MNIRMMTAMACLLCGVASAGMAQRTVEKTFASGPGERVELKLNFGDRISVKAWDRNEVSFKAEIEINGGKLDDALLLEFREEDSGLHVEAEYDRERIKEGRRGDCPPDHSSFSWGGGGDRQVICADITYTVYVPRESALTVDTISGNIVMEGLEGPVQAKSISGYVDLSWAEGRDADLSLKTVTGEAFTDLETIRFSNRKDAPPLVGYRLRGMIGRGGTEISLESVSGNLYLRRS